MIKYVFVLFLFLTGCNYVCPDKTTVNVGTTEVDAILEEDKDGRIRVVKIVKDKYDSSGYTK